MYSFAHHPEQAAVPHWRGWACLFLVFFLLYNPFAASLSSGCALNVCHPASNRATVGASELQNFSLAGGQDPLSTRDSATVGTFALFSETTARAFERAPQVTSPQQQFFGSSLWFRPPPAL
jgi:hypothetical protein